MTQPYPLPRGIRESEVLSGDGATTVFGPFQFKIFDIEDVETLISVAGGLWETATVTVAKVSGDPLDYFTIEFATAPASVDSFAVAGKRIAERSTDVTRGGGIDTNQLEKELSKQATEAQELRRDIDRALRLPPGAAGDDGIVTPGIDGQTLVWQDGRLTPGADQSDIANAQANAEDAQIYRDQALAAASSLVSLAISTRAVAATMTLTALDRITINRESAGKGLAPATYTVLAAGDPPAVTTEHDEWFQDAAGNYIILDDDDLSFAVFGGVSHASTNQDATWARVAKYFISRAGGILRLEGRQIACKLIALGAAVGLTILPENARLIELDDGAAAATPFITLGERCELERCDYTAAAGTVRRRVLHLSGDHSKCHGGSIIAAAQQNNRAALEDAAIKVTGNNCVLGGFTVENFDNATHTTGDDCLIFPVMAKSFVRAHWQEGCERTTFLGLSSRITSPNATGVNAGFNGTLWTGTLDCHAWVDTEDADEHGHRLGAANANLHFHRLRAHNCGGSGWKVRDSSLIVDPGNRTWNVNITCDYYEISDCGDESDGFGPNEEGVFVENCIGFKALAGRIFKVNKTKSCARGFIVNSSSNVEFHGDVEDCDDQAVYLENTAGSIEGVPQYFPLTDIKVRARVINPTSHACYIIFSETTIAGLDIEIVGDRIGGDGFHIVNSGTGTVTAGRVFRFAGALSGVTGAHAAGTGLSAAGSGNFIFEWLSNSVQRVYRPTATTTASLQQWHSNVGVADTRAGELFANGKLDLTGPIEFRPGAAVTPTANGDVVFELTDNTTLTIRAKGSDGTVRSGTVTLA